MRLIQKVGTWFDSRLKIGADIRETAAHPVPRNTASWLYVFGSAGHHCIHAPDIHGDFACSDLRSFKAGEAWSSLQILNHDITLGWFIRGLHGRSSDFMVAPS